MAINPRDPQNILAASYAAVSGRLTITAYYTKDGGKDWRRAILPRANGVSQSSIDPDVTFDEFGVGYLIYQTTDEIGFWVASTRDGGATWSTQHQYKGQYPYDRPFAVAAQGPWAGRLFVIGSSHLAFGSRYCAQANVAASEDHGISFGAARAWLADPTSCFTGSSPMLARSDGVIFTFVYSIDASGGGAYYVSPSFDGGNAYEPLREVAAYHQRAGDELNPPRLAGTALDASNGPHRGRIYFTYADWDGRRFRIRVVHSTSDWAHWSAPVSVDDDESRGYTAIPQIAVNREGTVAVIWTDTRNSFEDKCYQLAAAVSFDGGETFSRNYLHPYLTCAGNPKNRRYYVFDSGLPARRGGHFTLILERTDSAKWISGGDTLGLAARPDDSFGAAWSNGASGVQQLWYTAFRAAAGSATNSTRANEPNLDNGPSPSTSPTAYRSEIALAPITSNLNAGFRLNYMASYNAATHIITLVMRLQNVFPQSVRGPFLLTQVKTRGWDPLTDTPLQSDGSGDATASSAAYWIFRSASRNGTLRTGEETRPRILRWRLREDQLVDLLEFDVSRELP